MQELTVTVTPDALELAADFPGTLRAQVSGADGPVGYRWTLPPGLVPISPVNEPIVAFTTHGDARSGQTSVTVEAADASGRCAHGIAHVAIRSPRG